MGIGMLKRKSKTQGKTSKINRILNKTVRFISRGFKYAVPILVAAIYEQTSKKIIDDVRYNGDLNYGDAVRAISESDMFSNDKAKSISLVKEDGQAAYYRAIVAIALNSSMFSGDKYETITNITKRA